jgi:hypothetical protein
MSQLIQFVKKVVSQSKQSRPATDGNKNTNAKRGPVGAPMAAVKSKINATLKGPFC